MGIKVVKFGGSSLCDAEHFKKVREIVLDDPARCYVVPSAPGERTGRAHERAPVEGGRVGGVRQHDDLRSLHIALVEQLHEQRALHPLDHQPRRLVRQAHDVADVADGAHRVQVDGGGMIDHGIALGDEKDLLVVFHRLFQRVERALPRDVDRRHRIWKHHQPFQRNHRQPLGFLFALRIIQETDLQVLSMNIIQEAR